MLVLPHYLGPVTHLCPRPSVGPSVDLFILVMKFEEYKQIAVIPSFLFLSHGYEEINSKCIGCFIDFFLVLIS